MRNSPPHATLPLQNRQFLRSWLFLKIILALVFLIILLYIEEDWRGAHAWAATKAKWEAKGETFDFKKFIPPPVPDDQNIAALPLFKLESTPGLDGRSYISAVTLRHALRDDLPNLEYIPIAPWAKGDLPDMAATKKVMVENFTLAAKGAKPPDDLLAMLDSIYPFLPDFLTAASTRPAFRISLDYSVRPLFNRPYGPLTDPIKLAKLLSLQAILAIDQHQSDLAFQDVKINLTLAQGVGRDPTLVGGLVAIGVSAINNGAIYDGLARALTHIKMLPGEATG